MTVKQKLQEEIRTLKAELLAAGKTARINAANNTELANLVAKLTEADAVLREMLKLTIQCFDDLERDIKTHEPAYESFPMADKVMADARALLDKHAAMQGADNDQS